MKRVTEFSAASGGILGSIAVAIGVFISAKIVSRSPHPAAFSLSESNHQQAGQVAVNETFLQGGSLQRGLSGLERPQQFIVVQTGTGVPSYVTRDFTVHANDIVSVELYNNSHLNQTHDWALVKPGTLKKVATLARNTSATWDWIPDSSDILAFVPMTKPGESTIRLFRAPDEPGDYPFLCTYPGHGMAMNGVLHVVEAAQNNK